ncbi:TPA: ead/Ea22-like family protein [Escherichia coli]|nr:ead/Ea22-like family protein [Escherichia coli]
MSEINYQALREVAERAIPAMERLLMLPADDDLLSEQELKDYGVDIDALNAFKFLTGPETVLALLDERERNQQYIKRRDQENEEIALTVGKLRVELEAAEKRIAELEARAFNPAILDVIAERQRQQSVEGWMPEHDDEHCNGELAMAAVCYINETETVNRNGGKPWGWPWDASWWKPNARRRNLVKAGALILAEIERIDRAAGIGKGE